MIKYVIADGSGGYLKYDEFGGRYNIVRNQTLATMWASRNKAANTLGSCINKNLRKRYHVEEIECAEFGTNEQSQSTVVVAQENLDEMDKIDFSKADEWNKSIDSFVDFISDAKIHIAQHYALLSSIDRQINDIYHYIENEPLSAYKGWYMSDKLKQTLKKRRKVKDNISFLRSITAGMVDAESLSRIKKSARSLSEQQYTPRELSELFDEGNKNFVQH